LHAVENERRPNACITHPAVPAAAALTKRSADSTAEACSIIAFSQLISGLMPVTDLIRCRAYCTQRFAFPVGRLHHKTVAMAAGGWLACMTVRLIVCPVF